MGLFKRVAGGTALGNTLRSITNKISGGILGNGLLMKKAPVQTQVTTNDVNPVSTQNIISSGITAGIEAGLNKANAQYMSQSGANISSTANNGSEWLKNNKTIMFVVGGVLALVGLVVLIFKKKR